MATGNLLVRLGLKSAEFTQGIKKATRDTKGMSSAISSADTGTKKWSSGLASMKGVLAAVGFGVAVYEIKRFATASIKAASDLEEVGSKFNVVFAGQKNLVSDWADVLVDSYMMSTREAKQYLASVQDLLVPMGMAADKAAVMSNEVVKLSADLGSFNNMPTAKVMDDMQSALVGNFETMKKYGVVLNATVVQQKAFEMGLAASKDELTAGMKAEAAFALIVEGSTAAIGDADRTAGSYANQMKKLGANIEMVQAAIGGALIPIIKPLISWMNDWLKANRALIASKAEEYVVKLADSIVFAVGVVKFFHDGWLGLRLVGTAAVEGIAIGLLELFKTLRLVLLPLELIYEALVKLGIVSWNPITAGLDAVEKGLATFKLSSSDTRKQVLDDIAKSDIAYAKVTKAVVAWKDGLEAVQKKTDEVKKDTIVAEKKIVKSYDTMTVAAEDAFSDIFKKRIKELEKERAAVEKTVKAQEEFYRDLFYKTGLYGEEYLDARLKLLDIEVEELRAAGIEEVAITEYVNQQKRNISLETSKQLLAHSNSVAAGWKTALAEMQADMTTWADFGYEIFNAFTSNLTTTFSSMINDAFHGDMTSFGDYWESFLDNMLKTLADTLAKMAVEWATFNAFGMGGGGGGMGGGKGGGMDMMGIGSNLLGMGGGAMGMGIDALGMGGGALLGGAEWMGALALSNPITAAVLLAGVGLTQVNWKSLGKDVGDALSSAVDHTSDFVQDNLWDPIDDIFGGWFHGGGVIKAHKGLLPSQIGSQERMILAQTGEGIVSRKGMASLGEGSLSALNEGKSVSSGSAQAPIYITLQLDGEVLSRFIYDKSRDGDLMVHSRGITDQ